MTLNAFFSALILCVQYFADFADAYRTLRWLMGDLDVSSYQPIVTSLPLLLVAFVVFAWLARPLNLLSLGTDSAETRGLAVTSAQRRAFFSASLATGAAVSIGGPVGFIGIIVPHLVRLIVGSDHRVVLPASALFGAAFLVGCDVLARTLLAPVEIPVGVITALIGGPFFLWLLVRRLDLSECRPKLSRGGAGRRRTFSAHSDLAVRGWPVSMSHGTAFMITIFTRSSRSSRWPR